MSRTAGALLLLALLAIALYFYRFGRAIANVSTVFQGARIKQTGLENTTVGIRLAIDNPTTGGFSTGQPFIVLLWDGTEIGRSVPGTVRTQVAGNSRTNLPEIDITISHMALLTKAPQLYSLLLKKGTTVKMTAQVTLDANRIQTKQSFDFEVANPIAGLFNAPEQVSAATAAAAAGNNVLPDPQAVSGIL